MEALGQYDCKASIYKVSETWHCWVIADMQKKIELFNYLFVWALMYHMYLIVTKGNLILINSYKLRMKLQFYGHKSECALTFDITTTTTTTIVTITTTATILIVLFFLFFLYFSFQYNSHRVLDFFCLLSGICKHQGSHSSAGLHRGRRPLCHPVRAIVYYSIR